MTIEYFKRYPKVNVFYLFGSQTSDRRFTPFATVIFRMSFLLYSRGRLKPIPTGFTRTKGGRRMFPSRRFGRPSYARVRPYANIFPIYMFNEMVGLKTSYIHIYVNLISRQRFITDFHMILLMGKPS